GTTETRERWLLPLFQELGYGRIQTQKSIEIDSKLYPISHKAVEPIAIHLVSFRWDLDRRNPIAKSETKLSPHSLTQEFLNRSKDHLWGFLSNGYKLRILRDNISLTRSAYVEFDLQAMMEGEAYSDFFLLYLLCHQSRVEVKTDETGRTLSPETCWLEKWFNTAITEGVRALDELRGNVQSAIESLGAGFLSYPANAALRDKLRDGTLSLQDYYHQVLRQVYRLLFVFVAEDRDLLIPSDVPDATKQVYHKYYSTYRIRELARRKRGTQHSDLWQQIDLLFNGLYDGNVALGLPALGSFLFRASSTQELADCELANADLLSAVRFLCYTQKNNIFQPINYRNLGPEELGSVYESLLEMHPEINLEAGYFKLNVVSGSERKTTGSYYTPSSLVNCLLDSALEPVIANAIKRDSEIASLRDTTSLPGHLTTSPEQALLALKICDPACGSGHFLIAAAHRIAKRLAAIRAGEDEPAPSIIQHALRDVISHCIYGVDINPMSVELCKISLWMEALEPGKPLTFLEHHIQCGNSLLGCTPALLKEGIPDAAFTAVTGDDKDYCTKYKKRNKEESKGGVIDIFSGDEMPWEHLGNHASYVINMNQMDDSDLESLTRKEEAYEKIMRSSGYLNSKFIYDAWCAAFVWIKAPSDTLPYPITQRILDNIESNPYSVNPVIRTEVMRLAEEYQFFHWHIAFPDVFSPLSNSPSEQLTTSSTGWFGGFDCVLGNPPWENVELKEQEWFANKDTDIAIAKGSKRKSLIKALEVENSTLYSSYLEALRFYQATCILLNRDSGIYPLCGRGRINTYAIFAELNRILLSSNGYCGCIVPSGIATDDTTKFFFQDLFDTGSLKSLYDFENREALFPGVHRSFKFCLLTLRAPLTTHPSPLSIPANFFFFAHSVADLSDTERHFQLSREDIALINPNTRTCPIFR
ncbi:MAG: N-6 DNA methylase, partial [Candidatus Cloacimonetes bacterium]|nr:N-6 DNA methylase [Candidatus Cloacimonadota bacterium]